MDFNATIDLIIRDLDEAREIIDDLKKYPGVPVLQVELAKSKCKSAGEVIALLKNLQNSLSATEKSEHIFAEPIKAKSGKVESTETEPVRTEPIKDEPVKKEIPLGKKTVELMPDDTDINVSEKKVHVQPLSEVTIIADTFAHLSESLNEKLNTRKSDEEVSEILKTKRLTSLKEAIGVNDRFFYIREIFKGDREAYFQAISRLENVESLTDARAVIMSYAGENDPTEAIDQLLELMKRKLPSNG